MKLPASLLLIAVVGSAVAQSGNLEKRILGTWKFDASTARVYFNSAAKAEIQKMTPTQKNKMVKYMRDSTKEGFKNMTFTFKPNHEVGIWDGTPQVSGRWAVSGEHIQLEDHKGNPMPLMVGFTKSEGPNRLMLKTRDTYGDFTIDLVKTHAG